MKLKKTLIISAFPCCGKTYATEKLNQMGFTVLDSDSSEYSWNYVPDGYDSTGHVEYNKERNPNFPQNYIQHIKENIGKVDLIFVSSHKIVRDALIEAKINFTCVFPPESAKEQWVGKAFLRGSDNNFCKMIADNWDEWFNEIYQDAQNLDSNMIVDFLNDYIPTLYYYCAQRIRYEIFS